MKKLVDIVLGKKENANTVSIKTCLGQKARRLHFETLEERQLLSVNNDFPSGWADPVDHHPRYWVMNDSRTVIEGFLLVAENDTVTLKRGDGSEQVYAFTDFSMADQHFLNALSNDQALMDKALARSELQQEMFLDAFANAQVGQSGLPDLDVLFISRTPGSPSLHGKVDYIDGVPSLSPAGQAIESFDIAPGTLTTFTAHIANYGEAASGVFEGQWYIDGVAVGSQVSNRSRITVQ